MAEKVRTPQGVLSYPRLFTPKPRAQGQDPVFSANLIFDQAAQQTAEFKAMKRVVFDCIKAKWGDAKAADPKFIKSLMLPWRECADKSDTEGYDVDGGVYISPWAKQQPGVVDASLQAMTEGDVFGGQIARFTVRPFAWDVSGKKGVSFGLANVQIVKADMPAFGGGRSRPEDDFDAVRPAGGGASNDDDDVPFRLMWGG